MLEELPPIDKSKVLLAFWKKLHNVTQLVLSAKNHSEKFGGWNQKGSGEVVSLKNECNVIIFEEKGSWHSIQGADVNFSNVYRWTLSHDVQTVSLEHLRHGPDQPVFLLYLAPSGRNSLSSLDVHLCGGDTYVGQIHFDDYSLNLNWRVIGPKKNEELDYYYS